MTFVGTKYPDRDAAFAAWLGQHFYILDEVIAEIIPDHVDDPWSDAAIQAANDAIVDRFADKYELLADKNDRVYDCFVRYLGEPLVVRSGKEWTCRPEVDDGSPYFGVRFPWDEDATDIPSLLVTAVSRPDRDGWLFVLGWAVRDYEEHMAEHPEDREKYPLGEKDPDFYGDIGEEADKYLRPDGENLSPAALNYLRARRRGQ